MPKNKRQTSDKKTTNEKPVSLHPLKPKEALKALLETKPKADEQQSDEEGSEEKESA